MVSAVFLAAFAASAVAQDVEDDAPDDVENPAPEKAQPAQHSSQSGLNFSGPYAQHPYIRPVLGLVIWDGALGTSLGAEAGLRYRQEKPDPAMFGTTRVRASTILSPNLGGSDVRLGSFFGPVYKVVGLQVGPDVFYNQLSVEGIGALAGTAGVDLPLTGLFDVKVFNAYAGVTPGWYIGGARDNLSPLLGQMGLVAGAGISISRFSLSLGWSRLTTAYGLQEGYSIGIGF